MRSLPGPPKTQDPGRQFSGKYYVESATHSAKEDAPDVTGLPTPPVVGGVGGGQLGAPHERVENPRAAQGGADAESLEDAEGRVPGTLRHRDSAVSKEDYDSLLPKDPGAGVHRAQAAPAEQGGDPDSQGRVKVRMPWTGGEPSGQASEVQVRGWDPEKKEATTSGKEGADPSPASQFNPKEITADKSVPWQKHGK